MPSYILKARVDQIVTKEIELDVKASTRDAAEIIARRALELFPAPIEEPSVTRIQVKKSNYWIPRDIQFINYEKENDVA